METATTKKVLHDPDMIRAYDDAVDIVKKDSPLKKKKGDSQERKHLAWYDFFDGTKE